MKQYEKQAKDLLQKMTLKEKIGQLAQNFYGFKAYTRDENNKIILTDEFKAYVKKYGGIGMLNNYFRADPWTERDYTTGGITLSEREEAYNVLQKFFLEETRLGIPTIIEEDAPHGRQVLDSILYPVNCNSGCSFNPELYRKVAEGIGIESKLGGVMLPYLSLLDMSMDPRWGRSEECFSEDPYLASKLSEAGVKGMNDAENMVCCKHFAGQGATLGGHNGGITSIGERELREIHLPSTKAAVDAGCDFIMVAYNEIDGIPCHANSYLLNDVLRGEFGFDGVLRSDGCAIDKLEEITGNNRKLSAAIALKAGVDCSLWDESYEYLEDAVNSGLVSENDIDKAVLRLLEKKFKYKIMENPYLEENHQSQRYVESGKGQKIAYEMATESFVLLKNDGVLPLKKTQKVLLVGENLDNVYFLLGDYSSPRRNSKTVEDIFSANGADFIEGWSFEKGITVPEDKLFDAVNDADIVVFGCGGSSVRDFESVYNGAGTLKKTANYMDCGEGCDLASLRLHHSQTELIKEIKKLGKPIVSLVIGGRAYILDEICNNSNAVVFCGYPGQEGATAIYDTLFGNVNNFGRLAVSFPKNAGQLPINYNRKSKLDYIDIKDKPLFEFGFGLSYSEFCFSDFSVTEKNLSEIQNGERLEVSFKVKNISNRKGKAVPQLYIHRVGGTVTHRLKELCDFLKIELDTNEEKEIKLFINKESLLEWSINKKYELFPLDLRIMLGTSSEKILFEKTIHLM